jgi:type III secretion protein V
VNNLTKPPLPGASRLSDMALGILVVAVIVMIVMPLPPWLLDVLNGVNLSLGVLLLLTTLFMGAPLGMSTFPALLLITTLFRISLNVATTRQILLHADAGDVIESFGRLVVGGNLIVGLVVFLIITVVQFIVIAKGAERVAEVVARFTLDALPGKQMSIDADLRSGALNQKQAQEKRHELVQESQFYGSMDGAMKFVKGDAIAGIVIVLVNLLGGMAVGTLSMGMSLGQSVQTFAVLSIGDGLVSQIPALFVSIAAGIAITRNTPEKSTNLGAQIAQQIGAFPRAINMSAGVVALFALVPGFPPIIFLALALALALTGYRLRPSSQPNQGADGPKAVLKAARPEGRNHEIEIADERPEEAMPLAFRLELSSQLRDALEAERLDKALAAQRRRLKEDYGLPFPGLQVHVNAQLQDLRFRVLIQDLPAVELTLAPEHVLVLIHPRHPRVLALNLPPAPDTLRPPPPLLGPCLWMPKDKVPPKAGALEPHELIAHAVARAIAQNPAAALGIQEVKQMLKAFEESHDDLVREAGTALPISSLADLIVALATERVPINHFAHLLQAIVTHATNASDAAKVYENIRTALARGIVARLMGPDLHDLPLLALDEPTEKVLRQSMVSAEAGQGLSLLPEQTDALVLAIEDALLACEEPAPRALLVAAELRRPVSRLLRKTLPDLAIIQPGEVQASQVSTRTVGQVQAKWKPSGKA